MKKFEIDYLKQRVGEVVQCTNGSVSTRLNKLKKDTGLSNEVKYGLIKDGKGILKSTHELSTEDVGYHSSLFKALLKCYYYPTTPEQDERISFNQHIDNKTDEIHTEIALEGKRLVDRAVLGIVEAEAIPDELLKIGEMVSLAVVEGVTS